MANFACPEKIWHHDMVMQRQLCMLPHHILMLMLIW